MGITAVLHAEVPFETTSIVDGEFAAGTKWYTMQIGSSQLYISNNGDANFINLSGHGLTQGEDADLWCFVGDDTNGYKIYNKEAGATKVLASSSSMTAISGQSGTGGSTYPTLQSEAALPNGYIGAWDFAPSDKIANVDGFFLKLHGTNYAVNNFANLDKLSFWAEGMDAGSTVKISVAEATAIIDLDNGSFTASNNDKTYHSTWSSSVVSGLKFGTEANNMQPAAENNKLIACAPGGSACTYKLTAPRNYVITGFSFDFALSQNNSSTNQKLTIGGTDYTCTSTAQHAEVSGLEERIVTAFIESTPNAFVTISNFTVNIKAFSSPAEGLVFDTQGGTIPYRIPAIAQAHNGDIIAVADYRYSKGDIGSGRLDLRYRISSDNGANWGDVKTLVSWEHNAGGNLHSGYGDPCIVADCESDRVLVLSCSGNVMYPNANINHHQGIARFYSEDNGQTWSDPYDISDSIYNLFADSKIGSANSMFVGSGKISQSKTIKVGDYYRIYCAVLFKDVNDIEKNYALYSDDFGETWSVLGGVDVAPIPSGANEPKADELPDGSVLVSSRVNGGRYFNIFRYTDVAKAEGYWGTLDFSGSENNGTASPGYTCNGEILTVPVTRKSDNKDMFLLLQSVPFGYGRQNVGIYYKELETLANFNNAENIAKNWEHYQISTTTSCYSTMVLLADSTIAFLFEENSANSGYDIIYKNLSIEQITDSAYSVNPAVCADSVVAAGIATDFNSVRRCVGENVGNITSESFVGIEAAYDAYVAAPSREKYLAYNKSFADAECIVLRSDIKYRVRNKHYGRYLSMNTPRMVLANANANDEKQLVSFVPGSVEGSWKIWGETNNIYAGNTGQEESSLVAIKTTLAEASNYEVGSTKNGVSYFRCLTPDNASYPGLHAKSDGRIVRWDTSSDASSWYIEPTDIPTDIETILTESPAEGPETFYDLSGRRVENPKNGIYISNKKHKIIIR